MMKRPTTFVRSSAPTVGMSGPLVRSGVAATHDYFLSETGVVRAGPGGTRVPRVVFGVPPNTDRNARAGRPSQHASRVRSTDLSALLLVFLAALLVPTVARAEIPWRRATVSTQAANQSAAQLLRTFAIEQSLALQLNSSATTPISGDFNGLSARQFLDAVCDASELVWFWDGSRLHVDHAAESQTRLLNFEALTPEQASAVFQSLGFESGPASRALAVRGTGGLINLTGSAKFHEVVEPVLRALDAQEKERFAQAQQKAVTDASLARAQDAQLQVRVFRLTYASASDIVVRGGSTQSTLPGVARALQNIMGMPTGSLSTGVEATDRKRQLTGLRGTGLAAVGKEPAAPPSASAQKSPGEEDSASDKNQALIQAEPRLNAVIVRDTAARMPLYEALIAQLDVASPVIEISAAVVDIDADNGKSLGVEFLSFGDGKSSTKVRTGFDADRSFNQGNGDNTGATPTFVDGTDLVRGSGFASSVLVPVSGYELLTRIRALEEKGEAQLVTSPSVITLENVEAVIRQDQTVFIRVAGREASDLFDVRTGVQLRVTPTLVREGDQLTFRLLVDVQDGSFSDLRVDDVPSTRESAINTQAIVPADKTLLIGGYFVERNNNNTRQIPVLGNLPIVGRLFKRTENNHVRAQRFFFITPRLVDVHKEARLNKPSISAKSPLPASQTEPDRVTQQAHELVGRSLAPSAETAPAKP